MAKAANQRRHGGFHLALDGQSRPIYETVKLLNQMVGLMDHLSATFNALADPTRRAILSRLIAGQATVKELAEPFEMSLQAVSKHLKVLERGGLIIRGREAQWRPCRIEPKAFRVVDEWLQVYRRLWERRFDRLEEYLGELKSKDEKRGRRK